MTKVIHCNDVGFDCISAAKAEIEEALRHQVSAHANREHGVPAIRPKLLEQVKGGIYEESF